MSNPVGRPVKIVSVSFPEGHGVDEIAGLVRSVATEEVDLIALPETWQDMSGHRPEPLDGPAVTAMRSVAARTATYIVCPIDRLTEGRCFNSAVLIDRGGAIAGIYDKMYPYWSEFDYTLPVTPGAQAPVFECDFGRLGLAICFDVNFPSVWEALAAGGAELVVWSSAYSAGTSLKAHALNHHYYIVTATGVSDCIVYDIDGSEVLYRKATDVLVTRISLDLDRCIFHENFNMEARDRLLLDHDGKIQQDVWLDREQWFILAACAPGVSARETAKAYGMEELWDYKRRSKAEIDRRRERE